MTAPNALPLISKGVPAFTSDNNGGLNPASLANNSTYYTFWQSAGTPSVGTPVTLTYDLSGVASGSRGNIVLAWYNDSRTGPYDHTVKAVNANCIPRDYTILGNTAAGGGAPPGSGWVTLATVTGNVVHSRQHSLNFTTYNWIQLNITNVEGSAGLQFIQLNMDVHDAHLGVQDDWIFYGDSITQNGIFHDAGDGSLAQLINGLRSNYYPVYENAGTFGTTSADGAANISTWLPFFPGQYVAISYGTNDAAGAVSPSTFQTNMTTMITAVLARSCIPIIPTIPWGSYSGSNNVVGLNTIIQGLYTTFPSIIVGPDLYTYYSNNQSLIGSDGTHPTPSGYQAYRWQWTGVMLAKVYDSSAIKRFSAFML